MVDSCFLTHGLKCARCCFYSPHIDLQKKTFLSVYILKSTVEGFRECCFYVSRTKLQELLKKFGDLCVYTANRIADIRWFKPQGPRTIFGTNDSPVFIYPLLYSSSQHQVSYIIQFRRSWTFSLADLKSFTFSFWLNSPEFLKNGSQNGTFFECKLFSSTSDLS